MKVDLWLRRASAITLLFAAVACTTQRREDTAGSPTGARDPLNVMSFNIRYGTAPDGNHVWPLRLPLVVQVVTNFDPHVLGVQEALRFQLDELHTQLPGFREVGVGRDDGRTAGEYSAILYDTARLALLDQGTFWLSDTPEVPGSMSWGNRYVRIATWAHFRDRPNGRTFFVFNTHWDHESQPAREQSARLILERMAGRAARDPVLLLGDFNAGESNPAFRALLADARVRLIDTFRQVHPDAQAVGTYHAFRGDTTGERIDAILVTPEWQVMDAAIVRFAQAGRFPSDHFPVTARLR